jgi:hypothetical protein
MDSLKCSLGKTGLTSNAPWLKSGNGNEHFYPSIFPRHLKNDGMMKFSDGIGTWGTRKVAFISSTEGLPPIPPETTVEEDDYEQGSVNIPFHGNPRSFNGARNLSIVGGTFNTFSADAQVFHSWSSAGPTTSSSSRGGSSSRHQWQTTM